MTPGGLSIVEALQNKTNLKSVVLDGNQFGEAGKAKILAEMQKYGHDNILGSLSDDEGEPDDESDVNSDEGM